MRKEGVCVCMGVCEREREIERERLRNRERNEVEFNVPSTSSSKETRRFEIAGPGSASRETQKPFRGSPKT